MKAITIHGLDDVLADGIKNRAVQEGESLNGMVKRLLAEAMGMKKPAIGRHRDDFASFSGVWVDQDLKEFEANNADLERVDAEDWK